MDHEFEFELGWFKTKQKEISFVRDQIGIRDEIIRRLSLDLNRNIFHPNFFFNPRTMSALNNFTSKMKENIRQKLEDVKVCYFCGRVMMQQNINMECPRNRATTLPNTCSLLSSFFFDHNPLAVCMFCILVS